MGIGQGFAYAVNVLNAHRNADDFDPVSWYFPTFLNDELIAVPLGAPCEKMEAKSPSARAMSARASLCSRRLHLSFLSRTFCAAALPWTMLALCKSNRAVVVRHALLFLPRPHPFFGPWSWRAAAQAVHIIWKTVPVFMDLDNDILLWIR